MKLSAGCYKYTINGLTFQVVRVSEGPTRGMWYFVGGEREGGNDLYATKAEALAALHDYIPHRQHTKEYGWCYVTKGVRQ